MPSNMIQLNSELNKKAYVNIEAWRNRSVQGGKYPYVYAENTKIWPFSMHLWFQF